MDSIKSILEFESDFSLVRLTTHSVQELTNARQIRQKVIWFDIRVDDYRLLKNASFCDLSQAGTIL
jgi:hypothetical protein